MSPDHQPAPAEAQPDWDALLDTARLQVQNLDGLLHDEFEALRAQAFDRLETLQPAKLALLESLAALAARVQAQGEAPAQWTAVTDALRECRDTWRRNEQLVMRQLAVVRGALGALQAADAPVSVELYDRMGQTSRRLGSRHYNQA